MAISAETNAAADRMMMAMIMAFPLRIERRGSNKVLLPCGLPAGYHEKDDSDRLREPSAHDTACPPKVVAGFGIKACVKQGAKARQVNQKDRYAL